MTRGATQGNLKMNGRRQEANWILFFFLSDVNVPQVSPTLRNCAPSSAGYRHVCLSEVASVMRVSSDALVGFGWPVNGDYLVTELNFVAKLQVVAWRSDTHGLAVAVISPGAESASLIVG
jgi:hypothetical protein